MTTTTETPDDLSAPAVSDYVEQAEEPVLEEQMVPDKGYISVTACAAAFSDVDYTKGQIGDSAGHAILNYLARGQGLLEQDEHAIRKQITDYIISIAEYGKPEQKQALARALNIDNAADRFLAGHLRAQSGQLSAWQRQEYERVKQVEPVDMNAFFGTWLHTEYNAENHLSAIWQALSNDPVLSAAKHTTNHTLAGAIERMHAQTKALNDMFSLNGTLIGLGKMDFKSATRYPRESDGAPIIAYMYGDEKVELLEESLRIDEAVQTVNSFFDTFGNRLDLNQIRSLYDRNRAIGISINKHDYSFLDQGFDSPEKTRAYVIKLMHGRTPLSREQEKLYGSNFPHFEDLSRFAYTERVENTTYPHPVISKYPHLVDQIDATLKLIGYEDIKLHMNDSYLEPLRGIMKVLHAVRARGGAFGQYLGTAATPAAIAERNHRLGKQPGDEGYIEPTRHPKHILFNDELIPFDFDMLDHAIAEAKIAAERFGDKRLQQDFSRMLTRLEVYMTNAKIAAATYMDGEFIEVQDTVVPVFTVRKRTSAERTIYEISIPDEKAQQACGSADKAAITRYRTGRMETLKQIIEDSAYCEHTKPALVDGKLLLSNPPPYLSKYLDGALEKSEGIEQSLARLGERVAERTKGKSLQMGKVTTHPQTGACSVTLMNPDRMRPTEKDFYYQPLIDAIHAQFPAEKYPEMQFSIKQAQHLLIENAPAPVIDALKKGLGLGAGMAQGSA